MSSNTNDDKKSDTPDGKDVIATEIGVDANADTTGEQKGIETQTPNGEFPTLFSDEKGNLKVVNLVVRRPCTIFFSIIVICILINFWLVVTISRNGQPFTEDQVSFDMNDIRSIQYDSFRLAKEEVSELAIESGKDEDEVTPIQSDVFEFIYWVFEGETDNVFGSAKSINSMKETFDMYMDDPDYDKFCLLNYRDAKPDASELECSLPTTPLIAYFASSWDSEMVSAVIETLKDPEVVDTFNALSLCYALDLFCDQTPEDTTPQDIQLVLGLFTNVTAITSTWDMKGELVEDFEQVTELVSYLVQLDILRGGLIFGYDNNFSLENPKSKYSRGVFAWGAPLNLDGDLELTDGNITIEEELDAASKREEDDAIFKEYILENFFDEMKDIADPGHSDSLNSYYFGGFLIFDEILQIVQFDGLLAIASLLFVFFWLRINTGSFFLAGVGLFEIFCSVPLAWFLYRVVFRIQYFGFLNTLTIFIVAAIGADDIFIFMDAYKQSAFRDTDKLESLETRMTWVYRRTGKAMAITSATTCAAFLCTLITPIVDIRAFGVFAAFVILMDYVLVMTLFCTAVVIYHDRYERRNVFCGCCAPCGKTDPSPTEAAKTALEANEVGEKDDKVSNFFRTKFASFILSQKIRIGIFLLFIAWFAVGVWQASKLEPVRETEQFLDENNPLQKSFSIINSEFPTAEEDPSTKTFFVWGLGEVDRTGVNLLLNPGNTGKPTYVETFDFNEQCQTQLAKACTKLKSDTSYAPYIKRENGAGSILCFIEELAAYSVKGDLTDNCDYAQKQLWMNETWQIPPEDLADFMEEFLEQQSCVDQTRTVASEYADEIGWDGESMRYAAISVESEGLDLFTAPPQEFTRSKYDGFVSIQKDLNDLVSEYCTGSTIMTDLEQKFIFMNNQKLYVRTAVQSAIVGVAIAFVVLLLATRVFHIALFASFSIVSTLVSVVGMMVMLGWQLGSIESILIAVIAGFSVDYVVHLAHSYEDADGDTSDRVKAAFGDMGISVMNGMITSIAASIPLFFCQLSFFAKFGTFLCLTIAFSWIFANFVFMSALAQFKIPIKHGKGFHW